MVASYYWPIQALRESPMRNLSKQVRVHLSFGTASRTEAEAFRIFPAILDIAENFPCNKFVRAACGGANGELSDSNVGPAASGGSNQRSSGNPSLPVGTPAPWLDFLEASALASRKSKSGFRSTPRYLSR